MTNTAHRGITMPHYHRDERDEFIRYLAEQFPKCFFEEPTYRRPLKKNIIDDLEKRKVLNREKLLCTLSWYEGHFTYCYTVIHGAQRVDLDGQPAGIVTLKEQQEKRAYVTARRRELKEQRMVLPPAVPLPTASKEREETAMNNANGHSAPPDLHPALADLQSAITVVSSFLTEERYASLRPVLATTVLKEIVAKAETLIGELQQGGTQP
jgi:ProP effector